MRKSHVHSRASFGAGTVVLIVSSIVLCGTGIVATLSAMGIVDLPFLHRNSIPAGWVAVPMSAETIPAYTKLSRLHIMEPKTGVIKYRYLPPGEVSPETIVDHNAIIGRVLKREKPIGYGFTERDFLPKGTRAGMVAGIPAGKRSLTLEAGKLSGVFGLAVGDHIDLLATVPIDSSKGGRVGGLNGTLAAQAQVATMQKRASVRALAQDAVIVSPVTSRNKPTTSNSLTSGKQVRNVPVQEIVIAVDPSEVAPISEALATQVEITCVARSGLPDDPGSVSRTPGADPLSDLKVVDTISGKNRQALVFSPEGRRVADPAQEVAEARK
jgi:hypothetical protein